MLRLGLVGNCQILGLLHFKATQIVVQVIVTAVQV